ALEVRVHDQLLERMALEVAQQHALDLAVDVQVQDRRVEPLVLAGQPGLLVVELDADRIGLSAVDDGRHQARVTQAAARTFPLVLAARGLDGVLVCHFRLLTLLALAALRRWCGPPATRRAVWVSPRTAN